MLKRVYPKLAIIEEVPEVLNAAHLKAKISIVTFLALKYFHDALHETILHCRILLHDFKVRELHQELYSASLYDEVATN